MPNTIRVLPSAVEAPLCTKEAATLLGCTAKYVRRLRKEGILKGWRYTDRNGSHWHYSRLEVQLYIEQRKADNLRTGPTVTIPIRLK